MFPPVIFIPINLFYRAGIESEMISSSSNINNCSGGVSRVVDDFMQSITDVHSGAI